MLRKVVFILCIKFALVQCELLKGDSLMRFNEENILTVISNAITKVKTAECSKDLNDTLTGIRARKRWAVASKHKIVICLDFLKDFEIKKKLKP